MTDTAAPRVTLELNHETGEGSLHVADEATSGEIRAALDEIAVAMDKNGVGGWEVVSYLESGDDDVLDEHERLVYPVVRIEART